MIIINIGIIHFKNVIIKYKTADLTSFNSLIIQEICIKFYWKNRPAGV